MLSISDSRLEVLTVPRMNRFNRGMRPSRSWDEERSRRRDVDSSSFVPQPRDFHLRRGYGVPSIEGKVTRIGASKPGASEFQRIKKYEVRMECVVRADEKLTAFLKLAWLTRAC